MRDIAEALGVSIGTVDRALNARGRINADTRTRVIDAAARLGYRPNLAARYLSSRRRLRIAVCLPREVASFYSQVGAGIRAAADPLAESGVELVSHPYPRLGDGEPEAFAAAMADRADGIIIAPGNPARLRRAIADAAASGVPTVCVTTAAPGTAAVSSVAVDPSTSGALVGELLGHLAGGRAQVAVVTGGLETRDHARKLAGFRRALRRIWPRLALAAVIEAHDEAELAYEETCRLLRASPDLAGIYVSTANSLAVLRAIAASRHARVAVVTTDLFPALTPHLASGRVAATIHQRPLTQGQLAFEALHRYLRDGTPPEQATWLSPHVVMRSNLALFPEARRARAAR